MCFCQCARLTTKCEGTGTYASPPPLSLTSFLYVYIGKFSNKKQHLVIKCMPVCCIHTYRARTYSICEFIFGIYRDFWLEASHNRAKMVISRKSAWLERLSSYFWINIETKIPKKFAECSHLCIKYTKSVGPYLKLLCISICAL